MRMRWIVFDHMAAAKDVRRGVLPVLRYGILLAYYLITDILAYLAGFLWWGYREGGTKGSITAYLLMVVPPFLVFVQYEAMFTQYASANTIGMLILFYPAICNLTFKYRHYLPYIYLESPIQDQELRQQQYGDGHRDGRDDPDDPAGDVDPNGEAGPEFVEEPPDIDFDDVAGNADLKDELVSKVIDPLANPEKYEEYGLGVETGFLLYGPPGTGKTYTTKALAGEIGLNWMPVKGSDLTSKYIGAGTENIAAMFQEAIDHQPVLLFLDEIDALAPERGGAGQHEDQTKQVNAMLEWVSKIHDEDHDVVIIGATNRRDRIDDAMLRSGRLTTQIEVPYPDDVARIQIANEHLDAPRDKIDWQEIAFYSQGLSAADMEAVTEKAARAAMQREDTVGTDDLLRAIEVIKNQ